MRPLLVALLLLSAVSPARAQDGDPDALLDEGRLLQTRLKSAQTIRNCFRRSGIEELSAGMKNSSYDRLQAPRASGIGSARVSCG